MHAFQVDIRTQNVRKSDSHEKGPESDEEIVKEKTVRPIDTIARTHKHAETPTDTDTDAHTQTQTHRHTHRHTQTHTDTHRHTHTHTHTRTH